MIEGTMSEEGLLFGGGKAEELEALRALVRGLEAEVRVLRDDAHFFRSLVDLLPQSIYRKDREGRCTYANRAFLATVGQTLEEALGKTAHDYYPAALAAKYDADDRRVMQAGTTFETIEEHVVPTTGEKLYVKVIKGPVRDVEGTVVGTQGIFWDVTAAHTSERLAREVERQAAALGELGTPLMPIADGVVVMPLIGDIDRGRAERVLDTLLNGVTAHAAFVAILDVTGVTELDDEVASAIIQAARAVGLLGAEVVLTGMKPAMAQAVVTMGIDLAGLVTRATLKDGVKYALGRREGEEGAMHRGAGTARRGAGGSGSGSGGVRR
jgi:rsbT co-antagonist protein RsbR